MTPKSILVATAIAASAISAALWATASECPDTATQRPPAATVPIPSAPLRAKTPAPTRAYIIDCRLLDTTPGGKPTMLASPKLMTVEGRPAVIRVGQEIPPPKDSGVTKGPFKGLLFEVKVYRTRGGQTFVDAKLQTSWTAPNTKSDSVRLMNVGARIIEAVTLGQKISVPFGPGDEGTTARRLELTVSQVAGKPTPATAKTRPRITGS